MIKISLRTLSFLCLFLMFVSCAEERVSSMKDKLTADISFSMNISDVTRNGDSDAETVMPCPDLNELNAENFQAVIIINLFGNARDTAKLIRPILVRDGRVSTYPFSIILPDESQSAHQLARMTITSKGNENEIYYSSVTTRSKFKEFIPAEHWMPMDIELKKFEGKYFSTTLLCATEYTPGDFGDSQWEIDFVKIVCFGYKVHGADPCVPDRETRELKSTTQIYKTNQLTQETTLISSSATDTDLRGSLCFSDQTSINDDFEKFLLKITIPELNLVLTSQLTLNQIKNYSESGLWI